MTEPRFRRDGDALDGPRLSPAQVLHARIQLAADMLALVVQEDRTLPQPLQRHAAMVLGQLVALKSAVHEVHE